MTNKCDDDCLLCVKDGVKGKCLKCADDRKGNPQVGYLGMCMNRQSCPNGAFLVETDTHHYCEKCEENCDKCLDETECTHCSVGGDDPYYLEDGDCTDSIKDMHYEETYDEYYYRLKPCFYDYFIDDYSCMKCIDGRETSCTICNSDYLMIETKEGQGRCVNNCPYHWFAYYGSTL